MYPVIIFLIPQKMLTISGQQRFRRVLIWDNTIEHRIYNNNIMVSTCNTIFGGRTTVVIVRKL